VRGKVRVLSELSLTLFSFIKYIEYRHSNDTNDHILFRTCFANASDAIYSAEILYAMTFLFDKPLVHLGSLNRLTMKEENQLLDH
jgi:hypothetical protein